MKGKTILKVLGVLLLLAGGTLLMSFMKKKQKEVICKEMQITIPGGHFLITKEEVKAIVEEADSALFRHPITHAHLRSLEKAIKASPYAAAASVYADVDGVLKIEVTQREPLVRIINQQHAHFYMDREGYKMPLSRNYTPRVLVATGHIEEVFSPGGDSLETKLAADILKLARFIDEREFWKAQIGQVYVNEQKEIELIPRLGNHRILIGDSRQLEEKLGKLFIFYQKAMPRVGWDTYKLINLKYGNQIVASRDPQDSSKTQ